MLDHFEVCDNSCFLKTSWLFGVFWRCFTLHKEPKKWWTVQLNLTSDARRIKHKIWPGRIELIIWELSIELQSNIGCSDLVFITRWNFFFLQQSSIAYNWYNHFFWILYFISYFVFTGPLLGSGIYEPCHL